MRVRVYCDEQQSEHLEIVGGHDHPWAIDLITVTVAAALVAGFGAALAVQLVW